jgi:hypothetical protein
MEKLKLEKVNSKKQLEAQGYFKIDLNKGVWDFCWGKYVITSTRQNESSVLYFGGDILSQTPVESIKEALYLYNTYHYSCPEHYL